MAEGTDIFNSDTVESTEAIAEELARRLAPGACICLDGDLGAGKTQFVRGLVRGLSGPAHRVSSPTFMLLHVYPGGRVTVFHLDAYRVRSAEDFEQIGFGELLEQGGVVVVEWGSRVRDLLPSGHIRVAIESQGPTQRRIIIHGH